MEPVRWLTLGGFSLYAHQIVIALGIALGLWITGLRMRKAGLPKNGFWAFSALAVFLGFFLAHLGYCLARFEYALYDMPAGAFFRFWDGNYMLYGGMAGCVLSAVLAARLAKTSALGLMDAAAPGGAVMIAFVRIAQGLQGSGYGRYLEELSPFARFPFAVLDTYYEEWVWALFLLAALYAVVVFVLVALGKSRFPGDRALWFIGLYAAGQIVLESLRGDDFLRWGFVRCSQVISAVLVVFVLLCYALRLRKSHTWAKAFCWAACAALLTLCLLLEFAVEQKISFLVFLSPAGCYTVMALCCLALIGLVGWMRALSRAKETGGRLGVSGSGKRD